MYNTIIFAIIKNEHHYIEEWVEWHHNYVGIEHIYLIEDIGSQPHQEILSKYDYVTLIQLNDVITDTEKEDMINNKCDKVFLAYIIFHRLYKQDCNWCAFIDVDEFIDCDKETLNNILARNTDKISVTMQWLNMKCDGHIYHPNNWEKYSLLDTYKTYTTDGLYNEKYKQIINCRPIFHIFTKLKYWEWFPHMMSDELNNFDGNIKLKHFYSKSFEEFVWKLRNRGQCRSSRNYSRNFNSWFTINTEYYPQKEELFKEFNIQNIDDNLKFTEYI